MPITKKDITFKSLDIMSVTEKIADKLFHLSTFNLLIEHLLAEDNKQNIHEHIIKFRSALEISKQSAQYFKKNTYQDNIEEISAKFIFEARDLISKKKQHNKSTIDEIKQENISQILVKILTFSSIDEYFSNIKDHTAKKLKEIKLNMIDTSNITDMAVIRNIVGDILEIKECIAEHNEIINQIEEQLNKIHNEKNNQIPKKITKQQNLESKNIKQQLVKLSKEIEGLNIKISSKEEDIGIFQENIITYKKEINKNNKKIADLEKDKQQILYEMKENNIDQQTINSINNINNELTILKKKVTELESTIKSLKKEQSVLKESLPEKDKSLSECITEIEKIKTKLTPILEEAETVELELNSNARHKTFKGDNSERTTQHIKNKEKKKIQKEVDDLQAKYDTLWKEKAKLFEQKESLEIELNNFQKKQNDLDHEITEIKNRIKKINDNIQNINDEKKITQEKINVLSKHNPEKIKNLNNKKKSIDEKTSTFNNENSKLENDIILKKGKISKLEQEIETCKSKHSNIKKEIEIYKERQSNITNTDINSTLENASYAPLYNSTPEEEFCRMVYGLEFLQTIDFILKIQNPGIFINSNSNELYQESDAIEKLNIEGRLEKYLGILDKFKEQLRSSDSSLIKGVSEKIKEERNDILKQISQLEILETKNGKDCLDFLQFRSVLEQYLGFLGLYMSNSYQILKEKNPMFQQNDKMDLIISSINFTINDIIAICSVKKHQCHDNLNNDLVELVEIIELNELDTSQYIVNHSLAINEQSIDESMEEISNTILDQSDKDILGTILNQNIEDIAKLFNIMHEQHNQGKAASNQNSSHINQNNNHNNQILLSTSQSEEENQEQANRLIESGAMQCDNLKIQVGNQKFEFSGLGNKNNKSRNRSNSQEK
jgi:predicted  nucleic acid-binding Zn-ribbon protein